MTLYPQREAPDSGERGWPYRFSDSDPGTYDGMVFSWAQARDIAAANDAMLWPPVKSVDAEIGDQLA